MEQHAKVLAMIEDMDGCALWRVLLPFSELQRQGYQDIEWDSHKNPLVTYVFHEAWWRDHAYDAVILPRKHWAVDDQWMAERWFESLHKAGISVIYEIDDDLFSEDFEERLVTTKGYTAKKARSRRGDIMNTIQRCDGMTVSSQRLATMARQYVDIPIQVVPNYIDLRWFKRVQKSGQRDQNLTGITVGWAGGARPDEDVEQMAKAWGVLAKKYPNVTFVIMGYFPEVFYKHVPEERIAMIDWMSIDTYPVGMLNIDIGCCPLSNTIFNRAKTYIKAMEYAASGAAVVASPTIYGQLIEHGVDGYIARSVDDWVEHLSALIDDYKHRHDLSKALLAKVRKHHSLETQAWRWVYAWTELVEAHREKQSRQILLPAGVNLVGA
jgi:glycosyltransferase involved in cell wall biosynthesis